MPHQHSVTHTDLLELIQQHLEMYLQQPNPDGSKRSKAELARALYVDRTTLYKWLDGTNRIPAREGARLLQLLGVWEIESVE
ncbi:MAG TPA: hypothetical protein VFS21_26730 [Roseiflexaceae bacterium]|nr:hypothetical protein [Roseiflexaceae bacterium]